MLPIQAGVWSERVGLALGILAGAVGMIGLYVFFVEPLWMLPLLERATPNILYRVRTKKPLVALSFDDGPHPEFTPQVLEILQKHGARATFFLIGERALKHPEIVARICAAGHEVGNHYWENGPTLGHSDEKFVEKLETTEHSLENAKGDPGLKSEPGTPKTVRFFRAPGGVAWPRQLRLARERGYTCVLGCAYPHDPMWPPVKYIRWLIEKNLEPGTIVILHDGIKDATRSIEALPHILAEGERRGLKFVSIVELLDAGGCGDQKRTPYIAVRC